MDDFIIYAKPVNCMNVNALGDRDLKQITSVQLMGTPVHCTLFHGCLWIFVLMLHLMNAKDRLADGHTFWMGLLMERLTQISTSDMFMQRLGL